MESTTSPLSGIEFSGASIILPFVAQSLFWIALLATLTTALILYYHWIRYGVGIVGTLTVMVVYAVGVAVLVLAALGFLIQL